MPLSRHLLIAFLLCGLIGCTATPSASELARQRQLEEERRYTPAPPEIIALRQQLAEEYRQFFVAAYPSYNGIQIREAGKGFSVYHRLFTGYEFASGPLWSTVVQWARLNKDRLKKADIGYVGISASDGMNIQDVDKMTQE
jgi:hypothetical protein